MRYRSLVRAARESAPSPAADAPGHRPGVSA
jgi:hypothetical protein